MRAYAEPGDFTDPPPTGFIEQASALVELLTLRDVYEVDEDGYPVEPRLMQAFKRAVVAQVSYWITADVDPNVGLIGQAPEVTSQSTDGGSVSYTSLRSVEELKTALTTLCPAALAILRTERLTDGNGVPLLW